MKYRRSYDGLVTLGWLCAVVFIGARTEASLSDNDLEVRLSYGVMAAAVLLLTLVLFQGRRMRRRAEDKVRESEPVLLSDVQVLEKSSSQLLEDALDLHCSQMDRSRSDDGSVSLKSSRELICKPRMPVRALRDSRSQGTPGRSGC